MKCARAKSSNVKSVGYDATSKVLEVEFHTGAVYRYSGVPAKVHRALMEAESIGAAFHKLVRPLFKAELQPTKEEKHQERKRASVVTQCSVRGCPELASTVLGSELDGCYLCSLHAKEKALPKGWFPAHRVVRIRR
jgi:hypothetical protein